MNKTGNAGIFAETMSVWSSPPVWKHCWKLTNHTLWNWWLILLSLNFSSIIPAWRRLKIKIAECWLMKSYYGLRCGKCRQGQEEKSRQDHVFPDINILHIICSDLLDLYEKTSKGGKVTVESFLELANNHGIQVYFTVRMQNSVL